VLSYFTGIGLPSEQFQPIEDRETVADSVGADNHALGTVVERASLIFRRVSGIRVADSYAWARLNSDGSVREEKLFWPELPASVLADALALQAAASNPNFEASLPPHCPVSPGVVIHHSPGEWDGQFSAVATFDTVDLGSFPAVHHWDINGNAVTLSTEVPNAWGTGATPTPRP
jgi:hypothetical protein